MGGANFTNGTTDSAASTTAITTKVAYSYADPAAKAHGVMFSIFPDVITATLITGTEEIHVKVEPVPFLTQNTLKAPTQPAAADVCDAAGA